MELEAITAYCQAVEKNLDLPRAQKKQLLDGLRRELEERDDSVSDLASPEKMAAELMESVSPETVRAWRSRRKRHSAVGIAVLLVLLMVVLGTLIWHDSNQVARAETQIIEMSSNKN